MKGSNIIFAALLTCTICVQASAATLNTKIDLSADELTVGDVFTGAESNADHVLGPAPIAGNILVLDNKTLSRIADGYGIQWEGRTKSATARVKSVKVLEKQEAKAAGLVSVPVLAAPINRDAVISAGDIIRMDVPAKDLNDATALKEEDLIGLSARGLIQAKTPISMNQLVSPKVIKRGDNVTLTLNAGRINLTSKGKALADARMGEMVRVQNPDSEKIVQARVTGPQEAVIEPQI